MPVYPGCIATLTGTAFDLWSFIKSEPGQLLIALTLGAHTFCSRLRRLPGPEPTEFANTLMILIVFVLFILATELSIYVSFRVGRSMQRESDPGCGLEYRTAKREIVAALLALSSRKPLAAIRDDGRGVIGEPGKTSASSRQHHRGAAEPSALRNVSILNGFVKTTASASRLSDAPSSTRL